jgi:hypothetical protein
MLMCPKTLVTEMMRMKVVDQLQLLERLEMTTADVLAVWKKLTLVQKVFRCVDQS